MNWRASAAIVMIIIVWAGCNIQEAPVNLAADELERLLTADSSKSWILSNRINASPFEPCESDDLLTFIKSSPINDTLTIHFRSGSVFCPGQIDSVIFQGTWIIIDGLLSDSLELIITGDTTRRSLDLVTSQILSISYLHQNSIIIETYSRAN